MADIAQNLEDIRLEKEEIVMKDKLADLADKIIKLPSCEVMAEYCFQCYFSLIKWHFIGRYLLFRLICNP
jgi:hypothetical protein